MKQNYFLYLFIFIAVIGCGSKKQEQPQQPLKIFDPPSSYPTFDGSIAFDYVIKQTKFGPRVPGSKAHDNCLTFFQLELQKYADSIRLQNFSMTGYENSQLNLTNVIASFNPKAQKRILLCAHWDSRPRADQEEDEENKIKPIDGANDGASGAAILLALAKILKEHPAPIGVDLVFFDGEDYGKESDSFMYCLGAKYFSANIDQSYKPMFGILLDLVGDKKARFVKEGYSVQFASDIVELLWTSAKQLGITQFVDETYNDILDDHYSINTVAGIKTVDIIDAELVGNTGNDPNRKYWHTLQDTSEKISAVTLENVGKLLTYIIYGLLPS